MLREERKIRLYGAPSRDALLPEAWAKANDRRSRLELRNKDRMQRWRDRHVAWQVRSHYYFGTPAEIGKGKYGGYLGEPRPPTLDEIPKVASKWTELDEPLARLLSTEEQRKLSVRSLPSFSKYIAIVRSGRVLATFPAGEFLKLAASQSDEPRRFPGLEGVQLWLYRGEWYLADPELEEAEIKVLIERRKDTRTAKIEGARLRAAGEVRPTISPDVISFVWQRDAGKCVRCGSNRSLEIDHIIPFSLGGSSTARNLQLLCQDCNREKSAGI